MHTDQSNFFQFIQIRSLFFWFLFSLPIWILIYVIGDFLSDFKKNPTAKAMIFGALFYGLISAWIYWQFRKTQIPVKSLFKNPIDYFNWFSISSIVISLCLFTIGSFWLSYFPIYLWIPSFIDSILKMETFLTSTETPIPKIHNIYVVFESVLFAPVLEEILFRGLIVPRFITKWGLKWGLIISSLCFAVLHIAFVGSFIFALCMGILYLQTRSLIIPIICHASGNFIFLVFEGLNKWSAVKFNFFGNLEQFHAEWWIGVLFLVISIPFIVSFIYKNWPKEEEFVIGKTIASCSALPIEIKNESSH